jgi:pyridoxamine 5'-phosphate oxidase
MLPFESTDPFTMFHSWLDLATEKEPNNPNAMCLATADATGRPSARMVLLRKHDKEGFVFFTNLDSRKGHDLAANKAAALCFYWKTLQHQIRVEGHVIAARPDESDDYFQSRSRGRRIGAIASLQSHPLPDRKILEQRIAELETHYADKDDIPRPDHWGGFRLIPDKIEFWVEMPDRLHERLLFTREGDRWSKTLLYP